MTKDERQRTKDEGRFDPRPIARCTYTLLGALVSGALIVLCYGYVVWLPFFFDDLPHMAWLGGRSMADVWSVSSENIYYRPLAMTVYKLSQFLPKGPQQAVAHAVNPILHWLGALLVMGLARLLQEPSHATGEPGSIEPPLAGVLFAVFPFFFRAIPWFTALGHLMAVPLALLAAYAALRAERMRQPAWWAISLPATALAPLAHESGFVCGAIVGGLVIIQYGLRSSGRRLALIALGALLNMGAVYVRSRLPGTGAFDPDGLNSWFENTMFLLQGLVYPLGPAIGWLVHRRGWHDFALILGASAVLVLLLGWLIVRFRAWRWIASSLWWWAWASAPAAITFRYGGLVNSPRFYALPAVGLVILWAGILVRLAQLPRPAWARWLTGVILAGTLLASNVSFLWAQKDVHQAIAHVYQQILHAAEEEGNAPLGFVNVPAWLTPRDQTYPLSKDGAVMLPLYTNVWQYIAVNREQRAADNVMFVHVLQEPERIYWGFHGDWLDWEQMRQFAVEHRTVWLARWEQRGHTGRFVLHHVGTIDPGQPPARSPLARFGGGPVLEAASAQQLEKGHWTVTLTWHAEGPVEANVFVHLVDAAHNLVAQADGPALGGMVPPSIWRTGDRVVDVRHLTLPESGGPYTVLVGLYDAEGRLPAFVDGARAQDDAVPAAELAP